MHGFLCIWLSASSHPFAGKRGASGGYSGGTRPSCRGHRSLTDRGCRNASPGPRPVKLFDGHGLHLYVTPTGCKSWRLNYRFGGKKKQLTLAPYPTDGGAAEARGCPAHASRRYRSRQQGQGNPRATLSADAGRDHSSRSGQTMAGTAGRALASQSRQEGCPQPRGRCLSSPGLAPTFGDQAFRCAHGDRGARHAEPKKPRIRCSAKNGANGRHFRIPRPEQAGTGLGCACTQDAARAGRGS
ncbi:Arm DNA-binding domain-containing protein [Aurantiacibacter sp. DGU5]|uniref:Arm DNA-binding domain-containing protein n=1 Tax=Aurantiacibacter flavus TaxID=3145232 RepID=A0ABV0CT16_9SPHN